MAKIYKAILRGDRVEWLDTPLPPSPTAVEIIVIEEAAEVSTRRGHEMARILEALANVGGLSNVADAVEWQRELRRDRSLSGREP